MKKLLLIPFLFFSLIGYSQMNTFGGIGLRVNDTTTYQTNAAAYHTAGYYDIYFNNQATNDHWDVWNGSSYDHIFAFGSGGIGTHDKYISAAELWPRNTAGCSLLTPTEMATSIFNVQTLDFDPSTQEFAQGQIVLPKSWNNGTVTATVYWTATTTGSGGVVWGVSLGAYSDDDALTVALGTAQTATDTFITINDLHKSAATSAITVAGTPADADFLAIQISRNPADGSDTFAQDAKLLGIVLTYTTDADTD